MVGFFERSEGNRSMLRLLTFMGYILGSVVVLWGMTLLTVVVKAVLASKAGAFQLVEPVSLIIAGGAALAGGSQAFKVIQQRGEAKEALNGNGNGNVEKKVETVAGK